VTGNSGTELSPLPDLLRPELELVFVGINPGIESARTGHYFAHPRNRFWPAANAAGIFNPELSPETGHLAELQGIGFTDIVKRPTPSASNLKVSDFREGADRLQSNLLKFSPLLICFNGMTAYSNYLRHAEGITVRADFGEQHRMIGRSRVFVVPSPSPANAAFSLQHLIDSYSAVQRLRTQLVTARQDSAVTRG